MKNMYISILIIICTFSLISCSWQDSGWENSKNSGITIENISPLEKNKLITPIPVVYDATTRELSIWEIIISEWFPESFDGLNAPGGEKTYINSSVKNQYFFVTSKSKENILSYYRNIGTKNGWKEIKNLSISDNNRIFFEKQNIGLLPTEKITITISSSIPNNLMQLKLSGLYVEVTKE